MSSGCFNSEVSREVRDLGSVPNCRRASSWSTDCAATSVDDVAGSATVGGGGSVVRGDGILGGLGSSLRGRGRTVGGDCDLGGLGSTLTGRGGVGLDSGELAFRGVDGCCCSRRWLTVRSLLMHSAIFPSTTTLNEGSVLVALSWCATDDVLVPASTHETRLLLLLLLLLCCTEVVSRSARVCGKNDIRRCCDPGTGPILELACTSRTLFPTERAEKPALTPDGNVRCVPCKPEVNPVSPSDDDDDDEPSSDPSQMLSMRGQLPGSRLVRDVIVAGDATLFPVCLTGAERTKTSAGSTSAAGLTEIDLSTRIIWKKHDKRMV